MIDNPIKTFQQAGIYGLIKELEAESGAEDNPRVKAYNLLKAGLQVAKKSPSESLSVLPIIAFELSRHDSIYRMSALLANTLEDWNTALAYYVYLYYYYQNKDSTPHKQMNLIRQQLIDGGISKEQIEIAIQDGQTNYYQQNIKDIIKDYAGVLPEDDMTEQKDYFRRIYRHYGIDALMTAITDDIRFSSRQTAVLLIRASRAIGAIADEGPSIESRFADMALELDTSDTVIKNAYQAYLRAGDINKLTQLKEQYPSILKT